MKAAEDEFTENALPHIQARFCDSGLGSNIKLKIADYFPVRNVGQASEVTIQDRTLAQTVTTLRYQIIVAQRLFILRQKLPKKHQILAILCNKVKNLQATTHLFDTLRLFDT